MAGFNGLAWIRLPKVLSAAAFITAVSVGSMAAKPYEATNVEDAYATGTGLVRSGPEHNGWKIIRIEPPDESGELGKFIFGEGESTISPTSIRGPK